jgi:hypothetical protein
MKQNVAHVTSASEGAVTNKDLKLYLADLAKAVDDLLASDHK